MTQAEALQILKNSVKSRGGDVNNYSFAVHVEMRDFNTDGLGKIDTQYRFFVQNIAGGGVVAYGTSWPMVLADLDKLFNIPQEPITAEVPAVELLTEEQFNAPENQNRDNAIIGYKNVS